MVLSDACLLSFREETHKGDVIKFSQNKALECVRNKDLLDRDSACLLWDFIMLLCRQNGVGSREGDSAHFIINQK